MALMAITLTTLVAGSLIIGAGFTSPVTGNAEHTDHYYYLARNLAQGNLTADGIPDNYMDWLEWNGHRYLPLGPLPAVLLIPFLPLLEMGLNLVVIGLLLSVLNVWLLYKILVFLGITDSRLRWLLLLFFGGTVYFGIVMVSFSWFLAHIVTVTFLLAAILAVLDRRLPLLAGLLLGLAGMSRFTALFALPFFVAMLLYKGNEETRVTAPEFAKRLGMLLLGVAGPVLLLGLYNYARFGNPLDSGYAHVVLIDNVLREAMNQGLFSPVHIPKNLFMMLVQGPIPYPGEDAAVLQFPYIQPSKWGLGLFFTSPALLYIFRARIRPVVVASWLAVVCIMVPIITYYGVGWTQFGYRYALDFTPFLLLIAAFGFPAGMSPRARLLVALSVLVNMWGAVYLLTWT